MKFDREAYFNSVRSSLFFGAMTQQQVDGQSGLLSMLEDQETGTPYMDLRWGAYALATTYWETDRKMWPVEEYGKGKGKRYGTIDPETKQRYYGRGFVQLTWRENYRRATVKLALTDDRDLEWHANMALDFVIAARVMFRGMAEGWFTGKKLGMYFNETKDDPVNARAIINADVPTMGKKIADFHRKFLSALQDSFVTGLPEFPEFPTEPIPVPTPEPHTISIGTQGAITSIKVDGIEWLPPS